MRTLLMLLAAAALTVRGDVQNCVCDLSQPAASAKSGCQLCAVAAKEPEWESAFVIKDAAGSKPHQWLALTRKAYDGSLPLLRMSEAERLALWSVAVAKGRDLFENDWAVALNSDFRRTQCHFHVHIGKLLAGQELSTGVYVNNLFELPTVPDGRGFWFHAVGKRLHVHYDPAGEFVLEK